MRAASIYPHDRIYAIAHNELIQYDISYRENVACKKLIENAIADGYQNRNLDARIILATVTREFSLDRIRYVFAATIRWKKQDGRISPSNKKWAQTVNVISDPDPWGGDMCVNFIINKAHPGLFDLLVTRFRTEFDKKQ